MTTRNIFQIILVLTLVGFLLYLNRDWFTPEKVQIFHRAGPALRFHQPGQPDNKLVIPVFFEFNHKLKLTSVKVVPASDINSNQFLLPIWELTPVSRPVATKGFEYGADVPGMKPVRPDSSPGLLEPGKRYKLVIQTGSLTAEHDFIAEAPAR
jgi:hypothetical protein